MEIVGEVLVRLATLKDFLRFDYFNSWFESNFQARSSRVYIKMSVEGELFSKYTKFP